MKADKPVKKVRKCNPKLNRKRNWSPAYRFGISPKPHNKSQFTLIPGSKPKFTNKDWGEE